MYNINKNCNSSYCLCRLKIIAKDSEFIITKIKELPKVAKEGIKGKQATKEVHVDL